MAVSKYRAKTVYVQDIKFASKAESEFYLHLLKMKAEEEIKNFELQPEYELSPSFKRHGKTYKPIKYRADFLIYHNDGTEEVIDIKGMITDVAAIKFKLFRIKYDTKLTLIKKQGKTWLDIENKRIWG